MTVAEHLWFYSQLKGQARGGKEGAEELEEESDKMISDLGMRRAVLWTGTIMV